MGEPDATPSKKPDRGRRRKSGPRGAAWLFVILFTIYTLSFLLGYRFSIDSRANMWYLFTVAQHTTLLLHAFGDSAAVEPGPGAYGSGKRAAELEAWREGREPGPRPPTDYADEGPLSPRDEWLHKAYAKIRSGDSLADYGPTIFFVESIGSIAEMAGLRKDIENLKADTSVAAKKKRKSLKQLKYDLKMLERENNPFSTRDENSEIRRKGRRFRFMVVPDCGAIPSLAIFAGAVLAFPTLRRKRLLGLLGGLPLLYGINLFRLATLAYIGAVDPTAHKRWFSFSHEYVWQGIFVLFVVAVWMAWIEFVVRGRRA